MAKAKEKYVVTLLEGIDTVSLISETAEVILNNEGKLIFEDAVVGEIAPSDVVKWVMQSSAYTLIPNPPRASIRVKLSLVGSYGPKRSDVVICTRMSVIEEAPLKPQNKTLLKKNYKLEFRGAGSTNPKKAALIDAISKGGKPAVSFVRKETNEVVINYEGDSAGKLSVTEDIASIKWDQLKPESIKTMYAADRVIVVEVEVLEEEKVDYSSIIDIGLAIGMPKEQVEKRIDVLANRYFMSKDEIEFVAKSWVSVKAEGLSFIPNIDEVNYVDGNDRTLYYMLGYYAEEPNKNLRLVGIQSTGKNTLVEQLASLLWKPLLQLSCSRETSREDFEGAITIGHKVYKHDKAELEDKLLNGNFTDFQKASMMAKIVELSTETVVQTLEFLREPLVVGAIEGWWVLLDEINLTSSAVTSRFHSLLDYRREITVPKLGTVKAADGFAVVATMNPNSFVGANNMNQALETRFRTIELQPRKRIADILKTQCPKASDKEIKALDELYDNIFTEVANEKLPDSFLSVRNFIDALNIKGFAPLKQRVRHNVAHISVNEPDSNKIVEDIIDTLFQ